MSTEFNSDSSEGPLAAYTHLGGVQGLMFESMNEQMRNYITPVRFNENQNLQNLNCDDKGRSIDFGACEDVFKGKNSCADSQTKVEDKIDEVLLDIERIKRALGRGSTKLAEEWLREAREDLRELERTIKPEECGRHGQSEGDAPDVKPEWPLKPLKPLDPDYPLDPSNPLNPFRPGLPFPSRKPVVDIKPENPNDPIYWMMSTEPRLKPEPLPFRPKSLIVPD
jgi:hypothetical protein